MDKALPNHRVTTDKDAAIFWFCLFVITWVVAMLWWNEARDAKTEVAAYKLTINRLEADLATLEQGPMVSLHATRDGKAYLCKPRVRREWAEIAAKKCDEFGQWLIMARNTD